MISNLMHNSVGDDYPSYAIERGWYAINVTEMTALIDILLLPLLKAKQ
jgi:hypothetical protein